jgi:cysteine synthase
MSSATAAARRIDGSVVDAIELPRIIRLGENLYAAAFRLMKLCPARFILDRARDEGLLRPGSTIIETTSGTFGLALAMLAALRGYRLIMVSDPAMDDALCRRIRDLGARVEIVREPAAVGGFQGSRLARMAELQAEYPDHFWPSQYDNPHNPGGYACVAELLAETLGHVDCLVGTVGSGGSVCGTSRFLRLVSPDLHTVGVDTPGSVLFGQKDRKRLLRGLGNSLMPRNLDHACFDEVHWVTAGDAFRATRELHRDHALFMGATSGAAFHAARWWGRANPGRTVVAVLPDEGYRYQDTVYNDMWLHQQGLLHHRSAAEPELVQHPRDGGDGWTRMLWGRRSYEEVMGGPFVRPT